MPSRTYLIEVAYPLERQWKVDFVNNRRVWRIPKERFRSTREKFNDYLNEREELALDITTIHNENPAIPQIEAKLTVLNPSQQPTAGVWSATEWLHEARISNNVVAGTDDGTVGSEFPQPTDIGTLEGSVYWGLVKCFANNRQDDWKEIVQLVDFVFYPQGLAKSGNVTIQQPPSGWLGRSIAGYFEWRAYEVNIHNGAPKYFSIVQFLKNGNGGGDH